MTKKKLKPAGPEEFERPDWKISKSELWPLSRIVPYHNNPRTHPPAQVALLAELLKKYGPDQDIVVDEDAVILKGHGRHMAAMLAGLKEFPVTQRFGLSEADKMALRIADNQVALLSGWDEGLIRGEVVSLKNAGFKLDLLGFGDQQLVTFTTTPGPPSEFPEFNENLPTQHQCPRCQYRWSGQSAPPAEEPKPAKKPKKRKKPKSAKKAA